MLKKIGNRLIGQHNDGFASGESCSPPRGDLLGVRESTFRTVTSPNTPRNFKAAA
jgi:hypothetical protein